MILNDVALRPSLDVLVREADPFVHEPVFVIARWLDQVRKELA